MWLEMIVAKMDLEAAEEDKQYLSVVYGSSIMNKPDSWTRLRTTHFKVGKVGATCCLCSLLGLDLYQCYCALRYKSMCSTCCLIKRNLRHVEEVQIPASCVFVERAFLPLRGFGWSGSHDLRYHSYLISACYDLKDAVNIAYDVSFAVCKNSVVSSEKEGEAQGAGKTNKKNKS